MESSHPATNLKSSSLMVKEPADHKEKLKRDLMRLVQQIKKGCSKPICFKSNCKKNIFSKYSNLQSGPNRFEVNLVFANDQELLKYTLTQI